VSLQGGTIASSTGVLTGTSYDMQSGTVSAILAGAVNLTKSTSGTVMLSGANTFTGAVTVNAGKVQIGNSAAFGARNTAVTKVVVNSGGTVDFNGQIDATYGYTISGTGTSGAGALVNTGAAIGTGYA